MSNVQEALNAAIEELERVESLDDRNGTQAIYIDNYIARVAELERAIKVLEADAKRYRFLRNQTINEDLMPPRDGIFIGQIPQNLVLTAEHADEEIDKAMENNNEQH